MATSHSPSSKISLASVRELREEGSAAASAAGWAPDDSDQSQPRRDADATFAVTRVSNTDKMGAVEPFNAPVTEPADDGQSKNRREERRSALPQHYTTDAPTVSGADGAYALPNNMPEQPMPSLANPQQNHEEKQGDTQAYKAAGDTQSPATNCESRTNDKPGIGARGGLPSRSTIPGLWESCVMEEDMERNGALAGGRRVDYCLQVRLGCGAEICWPVPRMFFVIFAYLAYSICRIFHIKIRPGWAYYTYFFVRVSWHIF